MRLDQIFCSIPGAISKLKVMLTNSRYKPILIHILIWVVYAVVTYCITWVQNSGQSVYILDTLGKYLVAAFIFYFTILFALPFFLKSNKYFNYCFSVIFLSFSSFGLKQLLYLKVFTLFGYPHLPYSWMQSYIMNLWWVFTYTFFGFGYWFAQEAIRKEKEKAQLEKDKLQAEYAYLIAQINPHFLNNVLNFFYAKALRVSEPLADGILYLTDILRYVTNREEDDMGQIPLTVELEQIDNMININQLRFDNRLKIKFIKDGVFQNVRIIPFVLITLIENAFKHGEFLVTEDPLLISVAYENASKTFQVIVRNRKSVSNLPQSSGIGLVNVNRRLTYAYPDRHSLVTNDDGDFYTASLTIKF
jgi:two-component system, LytTR family, sensor kinase